MGGARSDWIGTVGYTLVRVVTIRLLIATVLIVVMILDLFVHGVIFICRTVTVARE
jgi:hypothetical protein